MGSEGVGEPTAERRATLNANTDGGASGYVVRALGLWGSGKSRWLVTNFLGAALRPEAQAG